LGKVRLTAAVTAAAVVAAFGIAACGDNNNGSSADEDQITAVLTRAATSGDPTSCTRDQTLRFVEQTNGGPQGQAAVKACEKDAKNTAAQKIDVTDVSVNGDTATATAKATGSIFDGQTIQVGLIKQNGQWKLDEFKGFEDFNKDAMIAAFTEQPDLKSAPPQAVDCLKTQLQKASDQQIEDTFTNANSKAGEQLFGPCDKYFKAG
jgi:hypothetical protein